MSEKIDFKKRDKLFYKPSAKVPVIVEVPSFPFLMINGKGNPGTSGEFQEAVSALYGLSYKIKMSPKKDRAPEGYFDYVVAPLEGLWDLPPGTDVSHEAQGINKDLLIWTIMIRQPEFVRSDFVELLKEELSAKEDNPAFNKVRFEKMADGLCCQMMHLGPFDNEPETFLKMEKWIEKEGYSRKEKKHREIYLSDFRRVAPEKLKTVLRFQVEKKE